MIILSTTSLATLFHVKIVCSFFNPANFFPVFHRGPVGRQQHRQHPQRHLQARPELQRASDQSDARLPRQVSGRETESAGREQRLLRHQQDVLDRRALGGSTNLVKHFQLGGPGGTTTKHRGSIRASHPSVPGLIIGVPEFIWCCWDCSTVALLRESEQCKCCVVDQTYLVLISGKTRATKKHFQLPRGSSIQIWPLINQKCWRRFMLKRLWVRILPGAGHVLLLSVDQ